MAGVEILKPVQLARKVALFFILVAVGLLLALVSSPPAWAPLHEILENTGLALMLVAIMGRCWCTLYIGGRKGAELVDVGPYSISRNPLYFFSFVAAVGMGMQTGSLTITAIFLVITWIVFRIVVDREERFLAGALGEAYAEYLRKTPRFLPNPSLWKGQEILQVRPRRVVFTFLDGLVFLAAAPLFEGVEWLQESHIVPVLLRLP